MASHQEIQQHYSSLLVQYFESLDEAALYSAAELGAELVAAELPLEDLAELHECALRDLTQHHPKLAPAEAGRRVSAPLMELLMAYGLAHRARRAERELIDAELERARRLEALGRLAGGVAHDFNNLLTTILGNVEFLLENDAVPKSVRDDLAEIEGAAQSAAALTRQLLTFGRRDRREPESLDLNTLLRDRWRLLERLAGKQNELVMELDEPLLEVRADRGQIEQVMLNLVANARDAMMPEGGRILIETTNIERDSPDGCPTFCPGHCAAARCAMLSVSDTGSGMDSETLSHIFDPFFTSKEPGKGTGLGLAVVHEVVARAEGHVHVDSSPNKGTRFRLLFPADAPP